MAPRTSLEKVVFSQNSRDVHQIFYSREAAQHRGSIIASRPSCPWFDSQRSWNFFREKIVVVAKVNQLCTLEESEDWRENVDRTRLAIQCYKNLQPVIDFNKLQVVLGEDVQSRILDGLADLADLADGKL